jgi:undecaprenyl-diphosphatase
MDVLHLVVLALIQGITEFLPISSSAHLILVPVVTGEADQGLAFDIAVHIGTLLAVVGYFRTEMVRLLEGGVAPLLRRPATADTRLAWLIVLATIPVGGAGLVFKDTVETVLRDPQVIAWASIGFGFLLWIADRWGPSVRDEATLGWRGALMVGAFQALALIPGTSRSGITMTAGRFLGLDRGAAARFAFLLAIPVIILSGGLQGLELATAERATPWAALAVAAMLSAISAWLCIALFLRYIARLGMTPFVVYRVVLGMVLLLVL